MTRLEYLDALAAALAAADPTFRQEARLELESHLDELALRRPDLSEAELVATLTPPGALAAALLAEAGPPLGSPSPLAPPVASPVAPQPPRPPLPPRPEWPGPGRPGPEAERGAGSSWGALGRFLQDSLGAAILRGSGASVAWEAAYPAEGLEEITLRFPSADILIGPASDDAVHLRLEVDAADAERHGPEPEVAWEDGCLRVSQRRRVGTLEVEVALPASILRLDIETASGQVEGDAGGAACRVTSGSGSLELRDLGPSRLHTGSGDVEVEGYAALDITSGSGSVRVEGGAGVLRIKTGSGAIEVDACPEAADVSSGSGALDLEFGPGAGRIKAETASGSIDLRAGPGFLGGGLIATSGAISVDLEAPDLEVLAESRAGRVTVGGRDAPEGLPQRLRRSFGRAEEVLVVTTTSGPIEVEVD